MSLAPGTVIGRFRATRSGTVRYEAVCPGCGQRVTHVKPGACEAAQARRRALLEFRAARAAGRQG